MKTYVRTIISTKEQDIVIRPAECQKSIIIETKELEDNILNWRTYLTKAEAETLILKIQEMIKYLEL